MAVERPKDRSKEERRKGGISCQEKSKSLHNSTKLDNLCGPQFMNRCTLELRNIIDTQEVTIDGKTKKVQTLKPIATAVAELKAGGGSSDVPGGGSSDIPGGGGVTPGEAGGE